MFVYLNLPGNLYNNPTSIIQDLIAKQKTKTIPVMENYNKQVLCYNSMYMTDTLPSSTICLSLYHIESCHGAVVTHSPLTTEVGGSNPALCGKFGSCLLMVSSLQYRTLTNCMYRFPLPTKLPIVI